MINCRTPTQIPNGYQIIREGSTHAHNFDVQVECDTGNGYMSTGNTHAIACTRDNNEYALDGCIQRVGMLSLIHISEPTRPY